MKFPLLALVALLVTPALVIGCTGSESVNTTGTGGMQASGTGGTTSGTGGSTSGTGGTTTGTGGTTSGTGGTTSGTGGTQTDGGKDATDAGGDSGGADAGALTFANDIFYELYDSCGGCHLGTTVQGGFDMKIMNNSMPGAAAYPAVTGTVTAAHNGCPSLDASKKRIVAGKPNNSLLYIKISVASPPSACGGHMPMGASMTQRQIDKIRNWITQGAMP